ncbi:MAG: CopD family protein [Gluconacetobacter diazotrophicus]|nr:CopD family protein [Gluconacetobacter diazotrophicus]
MAAGPIWGLVLALHLLGMAILVGGTIYALAVLRPSLGLLDVNQRNSIQLQTLKRFFFLIWHAMPLSIVTGWLMLAFPLAPAGGFGDRDWHIQAMQGLGILMAILFAIAFFGPYKRVRRALRPQPAAFDSLRSTLGINLVIALLIVVIASLDHVF